MPDNTSVPPTLITATAQHFVSTVWRAARGSCRAGASWSQPAPPATPAPLWLPALNLHLVLRGVGALARPRGLCCWLDWPGSPHHGDTGRRVRGQVAEGMGDNPSLQHSSVPGRAVPGQRGSCHQQHPQHGYGSSCCRGRCWAQTQMSSGAEPVVMCVSECVSVCLSVRLCTCECVCLCAQPGKVTVRERCQQPRNGLGMESVSQIGTQGQPEESCSSPSVVTVSICATAGVGLHETSPPGAGQGACPGGFGQDRGQGVPGGASDGCLAPG